MNLKRISASCFCLLLAGQMTLSAQNVSFSSNKVTLKSAFEKIEKESKYKIAYNSSQLDANRSVTLTKKSDDVFGMLNQLLKGTNLPMRWKATTSSSSLSKKLNLRLMARKSRYVV